MIAIRIAWEFNQYAQAFSNTYIDSLIKHTHILISNISTCNSIFLLFFIHVLLFDKNI